MGGLKGGGWGVWKGEGGGFGRGRVGFGEGRVGYEGGGLEGGRVEEVLKKMRV